MIIELAMAAAIQVQTTTCNTNYGTTTCNTYAPVQPPAVRQDPDAFGRAMRNTMNSMPDYRSDRPAEPRSPDSCAGGTWWLTDCTRADHDRAVRLRDGRQRTMELLQQGDCPGAVNAALGTNDLDYATQVRAYCSAGSAPVK